MRLGFLSQHQLQRGQLAVDGVDRVAHPEPEIGRHLIVARARRVQPPGGRADQILQAAFDVHMHVFKLALELEFAALDLVCDLIQALDDLAGVGLGDDALLRRACRACAFEPRISCGAKALSNEIEAFISCMISAGDEAKRPPHILLADLSVTGETNPRCGPYKRQHS